MIGVFDLDGCLSDDRWRRHMIRKSAADPWAAYHSHLHLDEAMNLELLDGYDRIIFVTARPEAYREATVGWLKNHLGAKFDRDKMSLYMRPKDDKRRSPALKIAMLEESEVLPMQIGAAYDDREDVIAAYRAWGITNAVLINRPNTPAENLRKMAETFEERSRVYGKNYLHFGKVCAALWPDGLTLVTEEDWVRLGVLVQLVSKLTRYTNSPTGHKDSAHDMGPYAAILEAVTK